MFTTIESKSLSEVIIKQIQDRIMNGELVLGDKLPPERELAQMLGTGRPAIREALKALEIIGLVESRHGQGNYIVNNMEDSYYKPLSLSFKLGNGKVEDIFKLREAIETFAVRIISENAAPETAAALNKINETMLAETNEIKIAEADKALHNEIIRLSNNNLFIGIWNSLSYLVDVLIDHSVHISLFTDKAIDDIHSEHLAIIQAIQNHDPEAAARAMEKHLHNINIELLKEL